MVTPAELLRVILGPVLVAAVLALFGRWLGGKVRRGKKSGWGDDGGRVVRRGMGGAIGAGLMPLAVGAGFLVGYSLLSVPKLPPRDGSDWLYWVTIPLTIWGVLDGVLGARKHVGWGEAIWRASVSALLFAGVTIVLMRPLVTGFKGGLSWPMVGQSAVQITVWGVLMSWLLGWSSKRLGNWAVVMGLWVVVSGVAIVVMSSNLRIVGVYGIALAAALGPVMVLIGSVPATRSVAIVALALMAGELVAGKYYPEQGVSVLNLWVLGLAPLGLVLAMLIPGTKNWVRGLIGVLLVAGTVAAVTVPTALKAAHDACETPSWSE